MNEKKKEFNSEANVFILSHPTIMPSSQEITEFGRMHICKYYVKYWKRLGIANQAVSLKCVNGQIRRT